MSDTAVVPSKSVPDSSPKRRKNPTVTASIHTQQTFQLHFIRRELVVGKTWVTKLQNAPCNDAKSTTLKMQVAREIKFHIVHTYVVVRSLPF